MIRDDDIIRAYTVEAAMQVSKGRQLGRAHANALVERMGLSAGDELEIVDVVERTLIVQKQERRKTALERMASRNWAPTPDYKLDRDEANER